MKILFLVWLISFSLNTYCQTTTDVWINKSRIDSLFASQIDRKMFKGAAFVIVERGKVVHKKGYGIFNPAKHSLVDPDNSVFSTASISKIFAAFSLLQLQEKGKCYLDDPVSKYLKKGKISNGYNTPITIKNLLTHTAGFESKFAGGLVKDPNDLTPLDDFYALRMPGVVMEPGTQISYSNLGAGLAGLMVQNISATSYDRYVQENIFARLGMAHSSFYQPPAKELQQQMAGQGKQPFFNPYPAASCVTTAADMGRLIEAVMMPYNPILSDNSLHQIFSQQWSATSQMPGMGYGFMQCWLNNQDGYFHTGDAGQHSEIFLIPSKKFGFYVVYTDLNEGLENPREVLTKFLLDTYFPMAVVKVKDNHIYQKDLSDYKGIFRINMYARTNFEKLAALPMQGTCSVNSIGSLSLTQFGSRPDTLNTAGKDLFRTKDGGYVYFGRSKTGIVNRITIAGSIWDPTGLERIAWYDNNVLHFFIVFLVFGAVLSRLIIGLVNSIQKKKRIVQADVSIHAAQKWIWRFTGFQCFLIMLVPVIGIAGLALTSKPFFGIPAFLLILLNLLILLAITSLFNAGFCIVAWKDNYWTRGRRVYFTFFSVAMLSFAWFIYYWNL